MGCRELIKQYSTLVLSGYVDHIEELLCNKGYGCSIDELIVRIVSDAEYLRSGRVIDLERKVVAAHHPVESRRYELDDRHLSSRQLTLELFLRSSLVRSHERSHMALHLRIACQDRKHFLVVLAHQLDHMREGTVDAALVYLEKPDDKTKEVGRGVLKEVISVVRTFLDAVHDDTGKGKGLGDVLQEFRKKWVTPVGMNRVIEIYGDELGLGHILRPVQSSLVIHLPAKIRILVVVHVHREALRCQLLYNRAIYRV